MLPRVGRGASGPLLVRQFEGGIVARRASPADIYRAGRAAVLSRLTQERRLSAERAEALVAAWEAEGDSRGLERMTAAFWEAGTAWIEEQLGEKY